MLSLFGATVCFGFDFHLFVFAIDLPLLRLSFGHVETCPTKNKYWIISPLSQRGQGGFGPDNFTPFLKGG